MKGNLIFLFFIINSLICSNAENRKDSITYNIEMSITSSKGNYTPFWLISNKFGMSSISNNNGYLRTGLQYYKEINKNWDINAGLQIAGGYKMTNNLWIHQAFADISWKNITVSIGSKERDGFPLQKNCSLTTGWMTEGINIRPIPQIRCEIPNFLSIPGLKDWLAFKGHIAYGKFMDSKWQENYTKSEKTYTKGSLYHSKSLLLKLGNKNKYPIDFEFGIVMATQFGGKRYKKKSDGSSELTMIMPNDFGAFWSAFFPMKGGSDTSESEQYNVEGNMLGSWNFAINYYLRDWTFRIHFDHFFEDHSQMFWEYGRWKDGQLGFEVTPPKNSWISNATFELISTKDQTGPIQYEENWGSFDGMQTSGNDNYYNHGIYNAWQHYGLAIGNPLLLGPIYNKDGSISFKSNRMKAFHIGLKGEPTNQIIWRILLTNSRYWGTYSNPLNEIKKQFYSLFEIAYSPYNLKNWTFIASGAADKGNYTGNSFGVTITIRKIGILWKK